MFARQTHARSFPVKVVVLWLLAGCAATGPTDAPWSSEVRLPAFLAVDGVTTTVELAASAHVGEATALRFLTFSGGCISEDTTVATVSGLQAEIHPFRRQAHQASPHTFCASVQRATWRVVPLRFLEPGRARVRIVGRANPGDHEFSVERELDVVP